MRRIATQTIGIRSPFRLGALLISVLLLLGTGPGYPSHAVSSNQVFDYLVVILMENHSLDEVNGTATYMTSLAQNYTLATQYSALDHPSEPNYLALIAGQTFTPNSTDDSYHVFNAPSLIDRIDSAGLSWKAYAESASGPCDTNNPDIRHVPFLFFADVANNPSRCDRVVPTTAPTDQELLNDLSSTSAASNFMWLTPNDCDNMHDSCKFGGDGYLAGLVPKILTSRIFATQNAALFIVFDEGSRSYPRDYVYASWSGPVVKRHYQSQVQYSHYSFLKTLEAVWNLGSLTTKDADAPPMTEFFSNNFPSTNGAVSGFLKNSRVLPGIGVAIAASIILLIFMHSSSLRSRKRVGTRHQALAV